MAADRDRALLIRPRRWRHRPTSSNRRWRSDRRTRCGNARGAACRVKGGPGRWLTYLDRSHNQCAASSAPGRREGRQRITCKVAKFFHYHIATLDVTAFITGTERGSSGRWILLKLG